jgi:hypothetical protein
MKPIRQESDPCVPAAAPKLRTRSHDPLSNFANRISKKLEEGDFKGAGHLAASDESLAAIVNHTLTELERKHPSSHTESSFPPQKVPLNLFVCTKAMVVKAIYSFPAGSVPGPA